jgi:hypothetical protein
MVYEYFNKATFKKVMCRPGVTALAVEHLPSQCRAQVLTPGLKKKKKRK